MLAELMAGISVVISAFALWRAWHNGMVKEALEIERQTNDRLRERIRLLEENIALLREENARLKMRIQLLEEENARLRERLRSAG